ncbi:MAG: hypothetical protein K6G15_12055 [Desulfovibrio sp.]|nr:hypothetical protein [Desulfovibrio sp.]
MKKTASQLFCHIYHSISPFQRCFPHGKPISLHENAQKTRKMITGNCDQTLLESANLTIPPLRRKKQKTEERKQRQANSAIRIREAGVQADCHVNALVFLALMRYRRGTLGHGIKQGHLSEKDPVDWLRQAGNV